MYLSREELQTRFMALDRRMTGLRNAKTADTALWQAMQEELLEPSMSVAPADRTWWWLQLCALLEHHELSAEPMWLG
jgi:hypothetical protein